tara:strand:+ start:1011 stop:1409 length:399 start_codon:yes stop_codon:yes gene_type:complete
MAHVDLSLQKKIISAAIWKGMGDRRFPMFPLLNAANQVMHMEQTGNMLQIDESGVALPMNAPNQILQTQAAVQQGTVVPAQPDRIDALTDEVSSLRDEVSKLVSHSKRQHTRIADVEKAVIQQTSPPNPSGD